MGSQALEASSRSAEVSQRPPVISFLKTRTSTSRPLLIGAFFASFLIAYLLVFAAGSFMQRSVSANLAGNLEPSGEEKVFSDSLFVHGSGVVARIANASRLNPSKDGTFILTVWFKVRKAVEPGERLQFLAKFDPDSLTKPGYSLALLGGPDGVRPQAYWQEAGGRGRGGWLTFASTTIVPKEWYLLAMSFRDRRFLGMHIRPLEKEGKVEVLGGYDLEGLELPESKSELVVGSFGTSKFRGRIGPVAVFEGKDIYSDIPRLLTTMTSSPEALPGEINTQDVVVWASPRIDNGPNTLSITAPPSRKLNR